MSSVVSPQTKKNRLRKNEKRASAAAPSRISRFVKRFFVEKKTNIEKKSLTGLGALRYIFFMTTTTTATAKYAADLRAAGRKFDRLVAAGKLAAAVRAYSRDLRVAGADYDTAAAPRAAKETP